MLICKFTDFKHQGYCDICCEDFLCISKKLNVAANKVSKNTKIGVGTKSGKHQEFESKL